MIDKKLREIAERIGNTPIIDVGGVWCKIEGKNPAGSVKDRAALYIISDAVKRGLLKEGGTVAEATSGNTGIGLSYVARECGLKAKIFMPESMSVERRRMLADYGAEVALTPAADGMEGAVKAAKKFVEEEGAFFADQFNNLSGISAHYNTTAPEIFGRLPDADYVVAGIGSGGTVMGIKKYIADNGSDCKVIGVEPASSPLLTKGYASPHGIQGIGANFVPSILDVTALDGVEDVADGDAVAAVKEIYAACGEKCGISSGAAYVAARRLSKRRPDAKIIAIFPDNGDRYSRELYE